MHGPHKMECVVHTTTFSKDVGKYGNFFFCISQLVGSQGEKKILMKNMQRPDIRRNNEKVRGILEIVFFGFKFEKDKIKMKAESI